MKKLRLPSSLALWQKFTFLGLLWLAMVIWPTVFYWKEANKAIAFSSQERLGLEPAKLMLNIIQRAQQHRELTARFLRDDAAAQNKELKKARRAKAEDLEESIVDLEDYARKTKNKNIEKSLDAIKENWHQISQHITIRDISVEKSFDAHTALIRQQLDALQMIVDTSQLSLDPEANGYFLISSSLIALPEFMEVFAQIRAVGTGMLARGQAGFTERVHLKSLLFLLQAKMTELDSNVAKAISVNISKKDIIQKSYQNSRDQSQSFVSLVQDEILSKETFSYAPDEYFAVSTKVIDSNYDFIRISIAQIDAVLQARIDAKRSAIAVFFTYIFSVTFLVMFTCIYFVRKLLRQLGGEPEYATGVVQEIARGNLHQHIKASSESSLLGNMKIMQRKLNENIRLKNEFISTVSHELRTPLTSIGGAISVIRTEKLGALSKPALDMLDIAHKNCMRLTELINDLLDIDKLASGQLVLEVKSQSIMPIVEESIAAINSYAEKYQVNIVIGERDDLARAAVDESRLQQVIVNLLSNAAKFSQPNKEVVINVIARDNVVRCEVVDQGCGIPEEFIPRIFQKFTQADSSDTRAAGGTGLGLAISKELIENMNGKVGFTSIAGVGSSFFFELPISE